MIIEYDNKKTNCLGIIYKATFSNGKCYIGQTTRSLDARKRDHISSKNKENVVFHNAINKYGENDIIWEIIDISDSITELNEKEMYWIKFYNSYIHFENSNGYNMTLGGESTLGWIPTEETKLKIGKSNKGRLSGDKNHQYGKKGELSQWWNRKHTQEEKDKISLANKNKIFSKETREKISLANKGKTKGIPKSEEHKKKISQSKLNHEVSNKTREKISNTKLIKRTIKELSMNIYKYMEESSRTCPDLGSDFNNQLHMAIGASTEANELLDAFKKQFAYNKPLDKVNVSEEIFDQFWYLVNLCRMLNIDIEKGLQNNIDKLKARYPEKFTEENAVNRDLEKEREILNKLEK